MNVLDLFSGIGGFSLGLERAGMRTVAFCEIDPFCRQVLAKHWPGVPRYDDVRSLTADRLSADGIAADVICGGFPCQDISVAGSQAGLAGERSGLWGEIARLVRELRPSFVIVENVSALLNLGMGDVLGDLAALGYDAEWHCIPASAIGAPHRRDRVWIIAYPGKIRRNTWRPEQSLQGPRLDGEAFVADPRFIGIQRLRNQLEKFSATGPGRPNTATHGNPWATGDPAEQQSGSESYVGRVADGIPNRTHRLGALGNAVVPQIPEIIGRAIMTAVTSGE